MSTNDTNAPDRGSECNALLGPLPDPTERTESWRDEWGYEHWNYAFTEGQMRTYALAEVARAVAAERERCAAWVDARRDAFCEAHGSIDPDTGTLEFGRGAHAEAKSEYVGELEEIAAGLRALRA